jgi:DnaJ-class molecular chaperone
MIKIDCPRCNGLGEIQGSTRHNTRVRWDDLSPDDYCHPCPDCDGTGQIEDTDQ